jgi:serine/threonine protein kinase/tetratricopeptide (TPR) repeat protein
VSAPSSSDRWREIETLVAEFVERRQSGEAIDRAGFVRAHAHLEPELGRALDHLDAADRLLPPPVPGVSDRIGPYRVVGEVGRGGVGRVLRVVRDGEPERVLALKLLHLGARHDARALERFRRESEVLRALVHENVVRVRDVGDDAMGPYLAMDLVEGESLAGRIAAARARGSTSGAPADRLDLPGEGDGCVRAARLVAQLARGITAVHRAGALHRDLKPGNVVLAADGRPVLIDFGMVGIESAPTLTRSGDLLGTPQYMAPEQARGERADDRTDVYGLGAILFELLTLEPPHASGEFLEVLERVRRLPPRRVRDLAPGVPRDLARVVDRALAFRRRSRTSNAALLAADLDAFAAGRKVAARNPSLAERVDRLWSFHRRAAVAAVSVLVLALGALYVRGEVEARRGAGDQRALDGAVRAWIADDDAECERLARTIRAHGALGETAAVLVAAAGGGAIPGDLADPVARALAEVERLHRAGEHREAIDALRRAAELRADSALTGYMLAREAGHAGDRELALRELSVTARLLPGCAALHRRIGTALAAAGRRAEAAEELRAAAQLDPVDAEIQRLLAVVLSALREFEASAEAARRAYELSQPEPNDSVLNVYAAALDSLGRRAEARAIFEELLRRHPGEAKYAYSIALTLDAECALLEARDAYRRAVELGDGARSLVCLAHLHAGSGSPDCAKCVQALAEHPELLDPELSERCLLQALDARDAHAVVPTIAQIATRIGRRDAVRAKLEALRGAASDDEHIAAFERALRTLR